MKSDKAVLPAMQEDIKPYYKELQYNEKRSKVFGEWAAV